MILYSISGVTPYKQIKFIKLDKIQDAILEQIKKTHRNCHELNDPCISEDIDLTFQMDGIYYQYDIEAWSICLKNILILSRRLQMSENVTEKMVNVFILTITTTKHYDRSN